MIIRTTLLAIVMAACSATPTQPLSSVPPTPTDGPPTVVPPTPAITEAPPSATPAPPELGAEWQPFSLPGEQVALSDGVSGDSGFVLIGSTCAGGGHCSQTASAWFQADGGSWERASVANAQEATMTDAAYNGAYFAAGTRLKSLGGGVIQPTGVVWRSDDRREWTVVGSLVFSECDMDNGCPGLTQFEVTQGGLMVATWGGGAGTPDLGTYRSRDGRSWARVDPRLVGHTNSDSAVTASIVFDDAIVLAWAGDNSSDLWSTETGRAWTRLGRLDTTGISLTSDGERLIAAGSGCPDACETRVWSWQVGAKFERSGDPIGDVIDAHIAFAGIGGFVLVGADSEGLAAFTSTDAATWVKRSPAPDLADCYPRALVGGQSTVILLADDCDHAWRSGGG